MIKHRLPIIFLLLGLVHNVQASTLPDFVQKTIDSMTRLNDAPLLNAPSYVSWAKRGIINQGIPRGDATPQWWADAIKDADIKKSTPWNALTGWITVFESSTNKAKDMRVHYSDFEIWVLKGRNIDIATWKKLITAPTTWGSYYSPDIIKWKGNAFLNTNYFRFKSNTVLHAGTAKIPFKGEDVLGVFVRFKAWIESPEPKAELLMSLGIDYYPHTNSSVEGGDFANANYLPGAGGSRFIYLTSKPTWYYMANIADQDLRNVDMSNAYVKRGGKHYLTIAQWQQNFPQLDRQ